MIKNDKHILIIDDNPKNIQVAALNLKKEMYKISIAQNVKHANKQLMKELPDLILLDIMMPGTDGFDYCTFLKSEPKFADIPVIFLTAKNRTKDIVKGFEAGGIDYIIKPFNHQELLIRVQTHLELADSKKRLKKMNREREKMFSIIAHDIKSPLSGIRQTIDTLKEGYIKAESEEFKEIIQHLSKSTKDTSDLLNNLLEWTSLQTQIGHINLQEIKLYPLIVENIAFIKDKANEKLLQIHNTVPDNFAFIAHKHSIDTILRNLLSNAVKFTPDNGTIRIGTNKTNNEVIISVIDTGIGMSEETINNILNYSNNFTTRGTRNEKGNGLGLSIVKDLVKKNNGTLEITSSLKSGSTFTITLPCKKSISP